MNIQQAKEEIKNAVRVYLARDEFGEYCIPIERQRPLFLLGAPGIGKTAIMEQIAQEMGIGLVSYSMTHHTRQSALGLPYIAHREFDGREFQVSEYTMSEIIASVYETIEETGQPEGILFLDEINCVSETLTPAILQFLQYKVFGRHRVPDGWVVVTAGNPSEYNRSTHDFDVAMWDRLKRIDVEPDLEVWKSYARSSHMHPAILTYLDAEPRDFYHVETTIEGKSFTTARGWDDLSRVMNVYEQQDIPVTERLIAQYLQDQRISKRFSIYYDLFNKYRSDYQVDAILASEETTAVISRAQAAPFDERLSLIELLVSTLSGRIHHVMLTDAATELIYGYVARMAEEQDEKDLRNECATIAHELSQTMSTGRNARTMSQDKRSAYASAHTFFEVWGQQAEVVTFDRIKADFVARANKLDDDVAHVGEWIDNVYAFLDAAFGAGRETLLFTTDVSSDSGMVAFINQYGCDSYVAHSEALLLEDRADELRRQAQSKVE